MAPWDLVFLVYPKKDEKHHIKILTQNKESTKNLLPTKRYSLMQSEVINICNLQNLITKENVLVDFEYRVNILGISKEFNCVTCF